MTGLFVEGVFGNEISDFFVCMWQNDVSLNSFIVALINSHDGFVALFELHSLSHLE